MAQFDVYSELKRPNRYFVNVQAEVLDSLGLRIVIPLYPKSPAIVPIGNLNPIFEVEGNPLILMTHLIAPIPVRALGPVVANLNRQADVIANALDMLLKGF